ncbi:hypothetical protein [Piscirickettsia salmonis]|nr:hypothetical protein [Piscirickettsia salmonis]
MKENKTNIYIACALTNMKKSVFANYSNHIKQLALWLKQKNIQLNTP